MIHNSGMLQNYFSKNETLLLVISRIPVQNQSPFQCPTYIFINIHILNLDLSGQHLLNNGSLFAHVLCARSDRFLNPDKLGENLDQVHYMRASTKYKTRLNLIKFIIV